MKSLTTLVFLLATSFAHASVTSFDDIEFWAGQGTNQAAIAIDWFGDDASDPSLVWGYRWNGSANGEEMLRAVLEADDRFYAKISTPGTFGTAFYGFGYDQNNDSLFQLDDNTVFDSDGIAISSPSDGTESISPADRYREGWALGYWHYGLASGSPTGWTSSPSGPTARTLSDGDWNSYAFATTLNNNEFAENLIAAEPDGLSGDFNNDGNVDAADYTVWRDGLGISYTQSDYNIWQSNFGEISSSSTSSSIALTIPEPATAALFFLVLSITWPAFGRNITPTNYPS